MKLKRIFKWSARAILVALVLGFLVGFIAYWRSTNDCDRKTALVNPMKAIVYCEYGGPEVLTLVDVEKPVPNDDQVLIKVRAASLNFIDPGLMRGPWPLRLMSGLRKPEKTGLGNDVAGTVEAVGKNVTQFKAGDEVFGVARPSLAEYACGRERGLVIKPANVTFEQAGAVAWAGFTALQGLRQGNIQPGQKVLINGATGGVGTLAVQIAKSFGAEVTGVCSTGKVDLVRSIGADHVIDYTKEDFTKSGQRYDVVLDNVGTQPLLGFTRVLNPKGKYVLIGGGGPNDAGWIGPLARPIKAMGLSPFVSQQMGMMFADLNKKDLTVLADLMQAGKVTPVIDRTYPLSQLADAIRYLEQGHARGKVVITLKDTNETSPVSANVAAGSVSRTGPVLLVVEFIAVVIGVTIVPIIVAFALNRRFQQRSPGKRPYRWGYYFGILSFIGAIGLANVFGSGVSAVIVCGLIYAILAWFFAQRHHWAWVTLTIFSFNPVAWIINSIYLWKRWAEDSVATAT